MAIDSPAPRAIPASPELRVQAARAEAKAEPTPRRLQSLDAYRGLIMITLAFNGFGLATTAALHLAQPTHAAREVALLADPQQGALGAAAGAVAGARVRMPIDTASPSFW